MMAKSGDVVGGIDVGTRTIKAVVLDGDVLLARTKALRGLGIEETEEEEVERLWFEVLSKSPVAKSETKCIGAVSADSDPVSFASNRVREAVAIARGAIRFCPSARTIIEVGAERVKGVRCNEAGRVERSVQNDRCAAGAGAFVEAIARALNVPLDSLGEISLKSHNSIPMSSECVVFAESEVVSLIHANTPKEDIARAVYDSLSRRIASMLSRIGVERDVVLAGGMAADVGFAASMERALGIDVLVPQNPEYIAAVGAALVAAEEN